MSAPPPFDPFEPLCEAFRKLLVAYPAYLPEFEAARHAIYRGDPPKDLDPYVDLGIFAEHLIGLAQKRDRTGFPAVFAMVEKLLVEGSPDVQNWVGVGVLEGVQNLIANAGLAYTLFEPWLGPETRKEWNALIMYWG